MVVDFSGLGIYPILSVIAMKLAELRKARGLSQRKLAASADISKSKIERLEYGENKIADISLSLAKRLADALGITMEELLKLD